MIDARTIVNAQYRLHFRQAIVKFQWLPTSRYTTMRRRPCGADCDIVPASKRASTSATLVANALSRQSLLQTLRELHEAGMLAGGRVTEHTLKKVAKAHTKIVTPYGPVLELFDIGLPRKERLEVCNPFALLYHWCTLSAVFADMMKSAIVAGIAQKLVAHTRTHTG